MTRLEHTVLFLGITVAISLFQFHLDWLDDVRMHHSPVLAAICNAMQAGPLFFFAVPVSVGAATEVWARRRLRIVPLPRCLSYLCAAPVLAMLEECFRVRYNAAPPDDAFFVVQGGACICHRSDQKGPPWVEIGPFWWFKIPHLGFSVHNSDMIVADNIQSSC